MVERLRRRSEALLQQATLAGPQAQAACEYKPDTAYEWIWRRLPEETKFWRTEVEEPCLLLLAGAGPEVKPTPDGDAPIDSAGTGPHGGGGNERFKLKHPRHPPTRPPAKKRLRVHKVEGGAYKQNRKGNHLCQGFQKGECTGPEHLCLEGGRHQCERCLS